jgi:hypothetical protein
MFRKSTLLAVVASAALGLAMLAPTAASAHGGHGGGHGGGGHGGGHGGGGHGGGHGGGYRHHHPHWHVRYHRPIWYAPRPVYIAARPVTVAGPCTCLSKEYTPEGAVVFKDRCTNEMAMNPPPAPPQQTGALQPQPGYAQQYVQPTPDNAQPSTTVK